MKKLLRITTFVNRVENSGQIRIDYSTRSVYEKRDDAYIFIGKYIDLWDLRRDIVQMYWQSFLKSDETLSRELTDLTQRSY